MAGGGVEHEQHFIHRQVLFGNTANLAELVHQVRLVLQSAGSIDDEHVRVRFLGLGGCLKGDGCRVGTVLVGADDGHIDACAPGFELVGGGRAEGVGRAHHDLLVFGHEQSSQFAGRGGLAGAVDADHDDDAGLGGTRLFGIEAAVRISTDQIEQLLLERGAYFGWVGFTSDAGVGSQVIDQLGGSIRTDVGKQQCVFDVFPIGLGEIVFGEDVEQGLAERVAGLGKFCLESGQSRADRFGGFRFGGSGLGGRLGLGLGSSCRFGFGLHG